MHVFVKKLLLLFLFVALKLEKVFGLSQFSYKNKRVKVVSLFIMISFIIIYPISWVQVLDFSPHNDSSTTIFARNLTFMFNWLLLVFIFTNEAFDSDYCQRGFGSIERLFRELIELQSFKDNLVLLVRCTLKTAVVFWGLIYVSAGKYEFLRKSNPTKWDVALEPMLYLPFVVMALVSNRIYAANNVVKHLLLINKKVMKTSASNNETVKLCAINYGRVFKFFVAFNKRNAFNFLVIISFCLLHVVYQSYFFYIQLAAFRQSKKPAFAIKRIAFICVTYISIYLLELFSMLQVYEDIKKISFSFNLIERPSDSKSLKVLHASEIFSLQRMHQNFKIAACGMMELDNTLMCNILAAIVSNLILLIQFKLDEKTPAVNEFNQRNGGWSDKKSGGWNKNGSVLNGKNLGGWDGTVNSKWVGKKADGGWAGNN